jgi:hypothetical protein
MSHQSPTHDLHAWRGVHEADCQTNTKENMMLRGGGLQVFYRTRVLRETIAHLSSHLASVPHDEVCLAGSDAMSLRDS